MTYLGVDPGLTGALALYTPERQELRVLDMPCVPRRMASGKVRQELNIAAVAHWLDLYVQPGQVHAYLENPHALPKQGITSAFRFGVVCGALQAVVTAYQIPMTLVDPSRWKRALALTHDKGECRQRAIQLLPAYAALFSRAKDDGRAEAALVAWYGAYKRA